MAAKLIILALTFSLFFISQVSSDFKNNEETSHGFGRVGDSRKLMQNLVIDLSTYLKDRLISRPLASASAPAPAPAPAPNPSHLDCGGLCKHRCSLHSRQNLCMRACGSCCVRCKCVPPGTYGNREMCGECYTNMTTHGNKPKCP